MTTSELEMPVRDSEVELTPEQRVDQAIQQAMGSTNYRSSGNQISVQEVKIFPQHVEIEVKGIRKCISLLDFKTMIDSQLQVETTLVGMALPYHTYVFGKSNTTIELASYYPERKMDLKHSDRGASAKIYKNCQMPNVVISHKLQAEDNNWKVVSSSFVCTSKKVTDLPDDRILTGTDINYVDIWPMPFPNFYSSGGMCFGGNTMPVKFGKNLRGLDYYYQVIGDSPFNNDLGLNVRAYSANIPGWFKHLTTLDAFDYSILRR